VHSTQSAYSARRLGDALRSSGHRLSDRGEHRITLSLDAMQPAESFRVVVDGKTIAIAGGDARGLIYGALAVAEHLRNGTSPAKLRGFSEKPALAFRGIKFNTPWDTYRRVLGMVSAMDEAGFGSCTNQYECSAVCPKLISHDFISRLNRDYLAATLRATFSQAPASTSGGAG
jgi:hypothetical protein